MGERLVFHIGYPTRDLCANVAGVIGPKSLAEFFELFAVLTDIAGVQDFEGKLVASRRREIPVQVGGQHLIRGCDVLGGA